MATYGGGLHRLEEGAGAPRFSRVSASEGLPDNNVNTVIEDEAGRIWASTDSGLAMVDTATMRARGLRRAEGVGYATFWTGSVARTAAGELLFGASGGVTVVRPALLAPWTHRPPVVVTELRVGGQRAAAARGPGAAACAARGQQPGGGLCGAGLLGPRTQPLLPTACWGTTATGWSSDPQRRLASYNNLPPGRLPAAAARQQPRRRLQRTAC